MQAKKKTCDGCRRVKNIWKNVLENGERKRYCAYCWSAHESNNSLKPTAHKPIRPRSSKRSAQEIAYNKRIRVWKQEHPYCEIAIFGVCTHKTQDVHHKGGRENDLLLAESDWLATCRACHEWCHTHNAEARVLGYIK